jgi:hypothetical protein
VALSACEAEINSGAAAARDALWVGLLLGELDGKVQCMPLYCDNQSALVMMREYAAGIGRRKHVDIAYQFVRNRVMRGEISVSYVESAGQLADMFTKALPAPTLERLRGLIGIKEI